MRIPYSAEQGIISAEQGFLAREQGILSAGGTSDILSYFARISGAAQSPK